MNNVGLSDHGSQKFTINKIQLYTHNRTSLFSTAFPVEWFIRNRADGKTCTQAGYEDIVDLSDCRAAFAYLTDPATNPSERDDVSWIMAQNEKTPKLLNLKRVVVGVCSYLLYLFPPPQILALYSFCFALFHFVLVIFFCFALLCCSCCRVFDWLIFLFAVFLFLFFRQ